MATDKQLKFYRKNAAPSSPAAGAVWFDTVQRTINIYTGSAWEPYAGQLHDASWDANNQKLVIEKYDGSKIELSFSDVASASQMALELGKKLNIGSNSDAEGVQSYYGLKKDIEAAKTALIGGDLLTAQPADDTIVGAKAYADDAVATLHDDFIPLFAAATTEINEKSEGHITVTKSTGGDGQAVYTIAENDIASASSLDAVDDRVAAIEAVMGGDDADTAINKVSEIITFLNGIEEGTVAKDTFDAVTAHGTAINNLQNNTVNGKKISENPVLAGSDVLLTGYTEQTAAALNAADSINVALGKLEARVDAAAAGGVQTVGGKAGAITLDTDATGNGNVKFAISDAGEISATVSVGVQQVELGQEPGMLMVDGVEFSLGLGTAALTDSDDYATAAQGGKADSALQNVVGSDYVTVSDKTSNSQTISVKTQEVSDASATAMGLAEASDVKSYVDNALC